MAWRATNGNESGMTFEEPCYRCFCAVEATHLSDRQAASITLGTPISRSALPNAHLIGEGVPLSLQVRVRRRKPSDAFRAKGTLSLHFRTERLRRAVRCR